MFELYFGAFDLVLYALAFIAAVMLSGSLCDGMDPGDAPIVSTAISPSTSAYVSCGSPSPKRASVIEVDSPGSDVSEANTVRPPADDPDKPVLRVADVRLYKLHNKSVVLLTALPFSIPNTIKRYMLRGQQVIRLEALQGIALVIA